MIPLSETLEYRTGQPFIRESDLDAINATSETTRDTESAAAVASDDRPRAPAVNVSCQGVGTSGGILADFICQGYQALGLDMLGSGIFDLAEPRRESAPFRPRRDLAFSEPADLYLYGPELIQEARRTLGEPAWQTLTRDVLITDRSLSGHGAQGDPDLARVATIGRRGEFENWAIAPLLPFAPQPRNRAGLAHWIEAERPIARMTDITCAGTPGAVGSSHVLQTVSVKRRYAESIGLTLDQYIVLIGARVFGRGTEAAVHGRIGPNEDRLLAALDQAMTSKQVTVGMERVTFSSALVDWGNVIVFDPQLFDPVTKTISEEARRSFLAEAALSIVIAFASGAMDRVRDIEANAPTLSGYVRTLRFVGHGLNRATLADELASRRVIRERQVLLDRITGVAAGQRGG